jgi:hypothetical protein
MASIPSGAETAGLASLSCACRCRMASSLASRLLCDPDRAPDMDAEQHEYSKNLISRI